MRPQSSGSLSAHSPRPGRLWGVGRGDAIVGRGAHEGQTCQTGHDAAAAAAAAAAATIAVTAVAAGGIRRCCSRTPPSAPRAARAPNRRLVISVAPLSASRVRMIAVLDLIGMNGSTAMRARSGCSSKAAATCACGWGEGKGSGMGGGWHGRWCEKAQGPSPSLLSAAPSRGARPAHSRAQVHGCGGLGGAALEVSAARLRDPPPCCCGARLGRFHHRSGHCIVEPRRMLPMWAHYADAAATAPASRSLLLCQVLPAAPLLPSPRRCRLGAPGATTAWPASPRGPRTWRSSS
jgi:hypothetical protein